MEEIKKKHRVKGSASPSQYKEHPILKNKVFVKEMLKYLTPMTFIAMSQASEHFYNVTRKTLLIDSSKMTDMCINDALHLALTWSDGTVPSSIQSIITALHDDAQECHITGGFLLAVLTWDVSVIHYEKSDIDILCKATEEDMSTKRKGEGQIQGYEHLQYLYNVGLPYEWNNEHMGRNKDVQRIAVKSGCTYKHVDMYDTSIVKNAYGGGGKLYIGAYKDIWSKETTLSGMKLFMLYQCHEISPANVARVIEKCLVRFKKYHDRGYKFRIHDNYYDLIYASVLNGSCSFPQEWIFRSKFEYYSRIQQTLRLDYSKIPKNLDKRVVEKIELWLYLWNPMTVAMTNLDVGYVGDYLRFGH